MKKLSTYLFLILFSFQTSSWADDIRDFQIEGMSVGDSLLDYFSKEKIENFFKQENAVNYYPKKKEIKNEISSIFPNAEQHDSGRQIDPEDNKSTWDRFDFFLSSGGSVDITCYDWSEESGNRDHLSIGINSEEFSKWLVNESNK